ncbi:PhzF family phenazine biosynthesis protein [Actinoallomurus sp. NBC_01490]|uniref:PhzF family phenazine biosynthesis protein n=1 Tax=Actinoallomurus sp. NBC_01490 TaxID=2903557 RepID=UPI002E360551|nr:PhzF family phenazine biosynthesis protein [Actinoallomurus sp. NBC_01490]
MTAWFLVDAFAEQPFTGNPAAVVMLGAPTDRTWMQATAAELHQPTSAFVWPEAGAWGIRWFTPSRELPLCGHATLAAAHVLDQDEIVFRHRDGTLTARRRDQLIWLGFPAVPVTQGQAPRAALDALGLTAAAGFASNDHEYVLTLDTAAQVEAVRPDIPQILRLPVGRLIVTAPGGADADFTSRVFVPAHGLDEDHVTGSAHAVLGPLWATRLGRARLEAVQASARRGRLALRVGDDQVHVGGHAVTVSRGDLFLNG